MTSDLRHKTLSALQWRSIEFIGQEGLVFVTSVILARLLLPEKFGLVAMLAIFMAVSTVFVESGFGAALIQRKNPSQTDCNTIFYFNILVGALATTIIYLAAPWIAAFYDEPILQPLTRYLSLKIVISSFGNVQRNLRHKALDYRAVAMIHIVGGVISAAIGITMAFQGYGVWALATQQLAAQALRSVFYWIRADWYPSLSFSLRALREMFGFGSKLLASSLLNTIFRNIYLFIIGWAFTPAALGFYAKAQGFKKLPSQGIAQIAGNVMFPVFSTIQDDPLRIKRGMKKSMQSLALITFPLMLGMAAVAEPMIVTLLGENWRPSAPLLQALCFGGLLYPLHAINLNTLQAMGRSDLFLRLEIVKKFLTVANILITFRWGVQAMVVGQALASYIAYYINSYYTGHLVSYPAREQLADLLPNLGLAVGMAGIVYTLHWLPFPNAWTLLICQVALGGVLYLPACYFLRLEAVDEFIGLARQRLPFLRPVLARL